MGLTGLGEKDVGESRNDAFVLACWTGLVGRVDVDNGKGMMVVWYL